MKRILTIVGVIVLLLVAAFFGLRAYTKSKSPEATVLENQNGLNVRVDYCQPYKRGRKIFGGIVPYGQVWRTGANEATLIDLGQNVTVAGRPVAQGKYSLWTIPSAGNWQVVLNKETGQWGTQYDPAQDLFRAPIAARAHQPAAEQFSIRFAPTAGGTDMLLTWDQTEAIVPIRLR